MEKGIVYEQSNLYNCTHRHLYITEDAKSYALIQNVRWESSLSHGEDTDSTDANWAILPTLPGATFFPQN